MSMKANDKTYSACIHYDLFDSSVVTLALTGYSQNTHSTNIYIYTDVCTSVSQEGFPVQR